MPGIGTRLASRAAAMLRSEPGVVAHLAELSEDAGVSLPQLTAAQIVEQLAPAEAVSQERYPTLYVACDKLSNSLREKSRRFSGKAHFTVECRVSQDRLEGLEARVRLLADAVAETLYANRGDWSEGMFYSGAYDIQVGPAKKGGKNLVQTAKVSFEVDVSTN